MNDSEYEWMPGSDRVKTRTVPTLIGEIGFDGRQQFPFRSWATSARFLYAEGALPLFQKCGSAAEAFFVRPFAEREGATVGTDGVATCGAVQLQTQVRCGRFYIDAVVSEGGYRLAIEVDGIAFHHRSKEQVAADCLRQRRIVAMGYTVIRFTAPEVFDNAVDCWHQVDAILAARRAA